MGFKKYVNKKLSHLSRAERKIIEPVLIKYAGILHDDKDSFKSTNVVVHKIETGDGTPIRKAPHKTPFALRQEMNRQVQKMLDKGAVSSSYSPWSSSVVLISRKSKNGIPKYRFCVDLRTLSAVTKHGSYSLPNLRRQRRPCSKYFYVLYCYPGFWQINIHEPHRGKSFQYHHWDIINNRLPYWLSKIPAHFQRLLDLVLKNLTGTEYWVFIKSLSIQLHQKSILRDWLTCSDGIVGLICNFNQRNASLRKTTLHT